MTKRRSIAAEARGKKERFLRYILRRKPLFIITFVEITTLIVLSILLALLIYFYIQMSLVLNKLIQEDNTLEKMDDFITFAHCNFQEPQIDPKTTFNFNTEFCQKRMEKESYAWRHYRLQNDEDETCMDVQEEVDCHESVSTIVTQFEKRIFSSCAGLNSVPMPNAKSEDIIIKVPALNETQLETYKNATILAQEVFLLCPQCEVRTRQFKVEVARGKYECMVKLNTAKPGWPAYSEDCDDMISIVHASKKCEAF